MLKFQQIVPLAFTAVSLGIFAPVEAATVNINSNGWVSSIRQLLLPLTGGDIYVDITFQFDSFDYIYGDPNAPTSEPFFWGQSTDAAIALTEINETLNGVVPIPTAAVGDSLEFGFPDIPQSDYIFAISYDGSTVQAIRGAFDGSTWTDGGTSPIDPFATTLYARFTEVSPPLVPEPSSLVALIVTGTSFLLLNKRKRD